MVELSPRRLHGPCLDVAVNDLRELVANTGSTQAKSHSLPSMLTWHSPTREIVPELEATRQCHLTYSHPLTAPGAAVLQLQQGAMSLDPAKLGLHMEAKHAR